MTTASIAKGKGYSKHNDRTLNVRKGKSKSWDDSLTHLNITYKNQPIAEAYEQLFSASVSRYNEKQRRADRQINNYYDKIARSKQEKTCYELIVQIGNIDDKQSDDYENIKKALDKYNKEFEKRNPNFYVFQQITHRDEKGMDHTHIQFIPFSTGNKRGLEKKNSLSGALTEMGYGRQGFDKWRAAEEEQMSKIMKEFNLTFERGDGRQEHLNVQAFRDYAQTKEKNLKLVEQNKTLQKQNESHETKLENLKVEEKQKTSEIAQKVAQIEDLKQEIEELENSKEKCLENPTHTIQKSDTVINAIAEIKIADIKIENNTKDFNRYLTDEKVTIKKTVFDKEPVVTMPLSFWNHVKESHNTLVDSLSQLKRVFENGISKIVELFSKAKREPEYVGVDVINQQKQEIKELEDDNIVLSTKIYNLENHLRDIGYSEETIELVEENQELEYDYIFDEEPERDDGWGR